MNCFRIDLLFRPVIAFVLILTAVTCSLVSAAELKVDFNASGRPLSETWDTAYTPWSTNQTWFAGGNAITNSFNGVTIRFTRVGSQGTALLTDRYAAGLTTAGWNAKLVSDGITVMDGNAGAQIEMRISGLSAGTHTVLAYLNTWQNPATHTFSPLNISVNGTQVLSNVPVSNRVTNNDASATAYLSFNATAGQDVVILFAAVTTGSQTDKNVCIDGFEIDTPNSLLQSKNPSPANADEHVNADAGSLTLSWAAAASAVSHNVYFGTSSNAVANATTGSAEFKNNRTSTSYPATGINSLLTYYWRVDEINSSGVVTKGDLWYFRPRHLAFPGAEGYGRFARGGRGGVVREVSNLNDSGAGSLRDAIEGNYGPRTIVFTVSGLITLQNDIIVDGNMPYITIAGQTAPGKGICIRQQQLGMSGARDVIFRHLRLRVGKDSGETQNATGMSGVDHCIMDHCSISWGIDEELSTRTAKNLTFQRCHISEALNIAGHQNYPAGTEHGYAATVGGNVASLHHNLLAHNEGRNWSLGGGLDGAGFYAGSLDIFNNVVYNWGGRTTDGGAHQVNFVNNYYKPGAASSIFTALNPQYGGFPGTQQYYMAGNVMPGHFTVANQSAGLNIGTESGGTLPQNSTPPYSATVSSPFFSSFATIDEVTNAYKKVLSDVGCTQPVVDDHDVRVIRETIDGTFTYTGTGSFGGSPGLPNSTADVGGWENYGTTTRPADWDTDHDGLPNWWEVIKGLNTNSAAGNFADANADLVGDGYTELDRYINWMAEPHADCNTGSTVDVNLASLSRGYTNSSPNYTFSGPVNGTVTLVNGNTARFSAGGAANALGSFNYTVMDNKGYTMTRAIGIRVIGSGGVTPPAAPTGLNASAGDTQISLSWTASSGATSYIVKRATINGGPYTSINTNATTSFLNTGLVNGTTYYYVVSAVNSGGESSNSSQVNATPQSGVPAAPTGLNATPGNAQVSLSWTASSGATSYRVKRATVNGGPYTSINTNAATSFLNTGLVNGTTYYYVVSAVNGSGESANSSQASATPSGGGGGSPATTQVESAVLGGGVTIDSNNAGFHGTGFANFPATGGFAQFNNVDGGIGGTATLIIRYALGVTTARTGLLLVNGASQSITFTYTGAWTNWTTITRNITLNAGTTNVIRFESNGGDLGNVDDIMVIPNGSTGLLSPWQTADIGTVAATGNVGYSSSVFSVVGSGADIGSTADEFRYVYQTASGDCTIVARVTAVEKTDASARAGVMIRETLNANSSMALCSLSPTNASFVRRTATGGSATITSNNGLSAPYWLRMQRVGSTFIASRSSNGSTWTTIGSNTITMATSVNIGLAVTSHADGTLCTATFDNVTPTP